MGFSIKKVVKSVTSNPLKAIANPYWAASAAGAKEAKDAIGLGPVEVPPPPGWTQQEWDAYNTNQGFLGKASANVAEQGNLDAMLSGLYNEDGTINPAAVKALREKISTTETQGGQLLDLERQRYMNALSGNAPVSVGLQQEEEDAFRQFRAEQARRGGGVQGTSFNNAVGSSTAANQRAAAMAKSYGYRKDEEGRAALNAGRQTTLGFYTGERAQPYSQSLGFAQNRAGLAQQYGALGSAYMASAKPFTDQRNTDYNYQLAQAGQRSANRNALFGLAGTLGGAALGGPVGAAIGNRITGQMGGGGAPVMPQGYSPNAPTGNKLSFF